MDSKILNALCSADAALAATLTAKASDERDLNMAAVLCRLAFDEIRPMLIEHAESIGEKHCMLPLEECKAGWKANGTLGYLP